VTRRSAHQQLQIKELEKVNVKLSTIMRVPSDYIDVEKDDEDQ
jgi:hypothetical protein